MPKPPPLGLVRHQHLTPVRVNDGMFLHKKVLENQCATIFAKTLIFTIGAIAWGSIIICLDSRREYLPSALLKRNAALNSKLIGIL